MGRSSPPAVLARVALLVDRDEPTTTLTACGVQEAEVSLNEVALGTFTVAQRDIQIDATFSADPPLSGPPYTIRHETIQTVVDDCGSAAYGLVGSTITLTPSGTAPIEPKDPTCA